MDSEKFWNATASENFNFVHHNETNFEKFHVFKNELDSRFEKVELERERSARIRNLRAWDEALPPRWRGASLGTIKKPVVPKILAALKASPQGSFYLTGESGSGKTFVSYAIVRKLIGIGFTTPSQIATVSEGLLLSWASGGFKGRESLDKLMDARHKVFMFDGLGALTPKETTAVAPAWELIIEHIYSRGLTAIFTSSIELEEFSSTLSSSGETKLYTLTHGRDFEVEPDGSLAMRGTSEPKKPTGAAGRAAAKDGAWNS